METVNGIKKEPANPFTSLMEGFENKVGTLERNISSGNANTISELKTIFFRLNNALEEKALKNIESVNELIELINSKEYNPNISVEKKADDLVVKLLTDIKDLLLKKRTWLFSIKRENNLVTGGEFTEK